MFSLRKLQRFFRSLPNLYRGYNLYVNPEKLALIDHVFRELFPEARSFADLGGVWNVDAAYTDHTLTHHTIERGFLVDTHYTNRAINRLKAFTHLHRIQSDFMKDEVIDAIHGVDVVYFFDVLLHQADPDWNDVLAKYARASRCFVVYNQQYIGGEETVRLTDMSLEEYKRLVPRRSDDFYKFVFEHPNQIDEATGKPLKSMHSIWQWGITDRDLRRVMGDLGYEEVHYRNYGQFSNLPAFEDHSFVFMRL